ncbi:MAG TPA: preprotein translocase subunit SecY [Gemmatimonadetes bacterium]|nr:preprotein translocase subunit SecY [Gemmatimonadota bacterium]
MANPIPNLFRVPELKEKILFTLFILLIYRVGAHITVPGVDVGILREQFGALQGGILGIYDMFVGGGLSRATILALGIMPYISASIMFQLLAAVFPTVEKLQKEGDDGRQKLTQWTRYTTVVLSIIQGFSYAAFLNSTGAVRDPGFIFNLTTTVTLTVGAIFVMWLGEQITERGIGNGMSLLIFFSIIEGFPAAVARTWESFVAGQIEIIAIVMLIAVLVLITAAVVAMTMGARKIPVQIPRKVVGRGRIREGQKSFVPLRINSAGVMPIIFAQSFIVVPGTIAQFAGQTGGFLDTVADIFQPGTVYYITYGLLIVFFTYFYTAIIFNPVDLAENLKKQGAFIPGVKPGTRTAEYIDRVLTRVTLPGSIYLALIALVPFWIFSIFNIQTFFFGGTALLIVVGVGLDTVQQAQQHLLLRHYDGFMKKGRVKMRGRSRYI